MITTKKDEFFSTLENELMSTFQNRFDITDDEFLSNPPLMSVSEDPYKICLTLFDFHEKKGIPYGQYDYKNVYENFSFVEDVVRYFYSQLVGKSILAQ